ncbi:MAG: hypothetical protein N2544_14515 [Burkholderiales bacterium]|nr:hypothetical protein [Burkholderiales bacterium]
MRRPIPGAAALLLLAAAAHGCDASAAQPFEIVARPARSVAVTARGTDRVAFDVRAGIGRAEIRAPEEGFPPEVAFRFPGFRHLEHVRVASTARSITCDLHRFEGGRTEHACRAEGTSFDGALARSQSGFELVLPPGFAGAWVSLEWVDQWRR